MGNQSYRTRNYFRDTSMQKVVLKLLQYFHDIIDSQSDFLQLRSISGFIRRYRQTRRFSPVSSRVKQIKSEKVKKQTGINNKHTLLSFRLLPSNSSKSLEFLFSSFHPGFFHQDCDIKPLT